MKQVLWFLLILISAEARELKTLVLVIASDNLPVYADFQKSWRSYMHSDPGHFESYFIKADPHLPTRYEIIGDTIWTQCEESHTPGLLNKTLIAFEAFASRLNEFDYVLRANLSSFFVFPRMLPFLETLPKQNCYCGIYHGGSSRFPHPQWKWANGSGIIFSPDLIKLLLSYKQVLFNSQVVDDVMFGVFFDHLPIIPSRSVEIYTQFDWFNVVNQMPEDLFHFRIRVEPNRSLDSYIHSHLLKRFYPHDFVKNR